MGIRCSGILWPLAREAYLGEPRDHRDGGERERTWPEDSYLSLSLTRCSISRTSEN